eukprot:CAMPEP_0182597574 /NCGR_PEP_ID=MMETSP1324-20130603/86525_1 /TAXON_ID=236786 /ORGANISM="Florenciella sp., Strain RCC1587" /LENGTH=123 /DNA_ID=CAMNT_0024815335 /DNA_START=243 /DNA_END=614 /DNA_ORIENTATION=-
MKMHNCGLFSAEACPDSAAVEFFSEGDCQPPHIEHHDFDRPVFTLSLGSTQRIVMGQKIHIHEAGKFVSDVELALPTGSVLARKDHSANVPKLAVPCVSAPRVSITFRRIKPRFLQQQQGHVS